ncbi:protein tolB [Senna tora]|uniref:Protein tolB n=1 Tax=Senna tora TaxID=362788 RepID=A0A834SV67_9FABA|nr:protein tolB [Senna tora]
MIVSNLHFLLMFLIFLSSVTADHDTSSGTSILYYSFGRTNFAFDIYTLPILHSPTPQRQTKLTDGRSVNFNGHFPSPSSSSLLLSLLPNHTAIRTRPDSNSLPLVYVTERDDGFSTVYLDWVYSSDDEYTRRRSSLEVGSVADRIQIPLLGNDPNRKRVSMKDRPSVSGEYLVYVSTHEDPGVLMASWAAVYSTHLKTGSTRRLTPYGVADFSPAVSPSGIFTAVASYGERGWSGEVEDLTTDIYVFMTRDGSERVKVVEHGGWPSWVDDRTIYFHRRGDDQWMSVYRAILPSHGSISTDTVAIERVTPPGIHAFTPATSPGNNDFIAVATKRKTSSYRHIELFDLVKKEFKELTRLVSPDSYHYNPFLSPDATRVGYHKCRGKPKENESPVMMLDNIRTTNPDLSLFRFDGSFPAFSPSGDRLIYVGTGVSVMNPDGSNQREVSNAYAISTAWDPVRPGVVYIASGFPFSPASTEVNIISIDIDENNEKKLTINGKNNAFPSPSPDGKWLVFRSGRSGYMNLYIMDAVEGERNGLQRLTEGPWTDTMCVWSPDGDWIVFASDRINPGGRSFELYMIHPNGTGLRKVIPRAAGARASHPSFSPDGKSLVFTADFAGLSAEPISVPIQIQPYGEIFTVKLDGSDLTRLTHDAYEDGLPAWSPRYIGPRNVERPKGGSYCSFGDGRWLENKPNTNRVQCEQLDLKKETIMQTMSVLPLSHAFSTDVPEISANFVENLMAELKIDDQGSEKEVVEQEQEQEGEEDEEEFSFACTNPDGSAISADDAFDNGQIRPMFPVFDRNLLFSDEYDGSSAPPSPLRKVFVEQRGLFSSLSSSESESDELEGAAPEGTYCEWSAKTAVEAASSSKCNKSNSTGFSKLWKFRESKLRSNSDGKDAFVFLNSPANRSTAKPGNSGKDTEKAVTAKAKTQQTTTQNGVVKAAKSKTTSPAHRNPYALKKESDKRKSYLPYRQDLVGIGIFTNVNGLSRNVHPF